MCNRFYAFLVNSKTIFYYLWIKNIIFHVLIYWNNSANEIKTTISHIWAVLMLSMIYIFFWNIFSYANFIFRCSPIFTRRIYCIRWNFWTPIFEGFYTFCLSVSLSASNMNFVGTFYRRRCYAAFLQF